MSAAHNRLQIFGGARVIYLGVQLMQAANELVKVSESRGIQTLTSQAFDAYTQTRADLESAMRIDLGIQKLDSLSEQWFDRTKQEKLHEEWRGKVWSDFRDKLPKS